MVSDISAHCVISQLKQQAGGKAQVFVPNALFLGNPGTGKTTVAKIVAQMYKEIGLLRKGHLVATDFSGLIGEFVGQTAPKVKEVFKSALGGVLFIDEAYALNSGRSSYGKEAVATLAHLMTEHRGQCCVILAGYEEEMNRMMCETNRGIRERFPFRLVFDDYDADELVDIFIGKLSDAKLRISKEALAIATNIIRKQKDSCSEDFANARMVDNVFQEIGMQQERRLIKAKEHSARTLLSITKADCELAAQKISVPTAKQTGLKLPIGFSVA
jgi:SpoVK/Ycf46/Vps4 family AAA+-type ATPase